MNPLRVLVVDDELLARRRLLRLLAAMPDVEIAGECARGDELLARARGVDAVLLDIEMPGLSGVEALSLWPESGPAVIFCTAHAQHAVAAFDGGAIDYVLKPIDGARLQIALGRVRARRPLPSHETKPAQRLAVESGNGIVLLDPADISSLVLEGELVTLQARAGRYFSTEPLSELHLRLPEDRFVRVHRRAIVNLDHVERFDAARTGGLLARMRNGSLVVVSRQAARELRRRWKIA